MMNKYRKAYYEIEKIIRCVKRPIIIVMGLRRTGKTTVLRQLASNHNGYYIDFRKEENGKDKYVEAFHRDEDLLLLDEIGHLDSYDSYMDIIDDFINENPPEEKKSEQKTNKKNKKSEIIPDEVIADIAADISEINAEKFGT